MAIFKCKMCGGQLNVTQGSTVAVCEYCGTQQTLSKSTDEVMTNLFSRANDLRLQSEFDKAQEVYEKILDNDNSDAEAHWGVLLCKYGIEYVEDPKSSKRIPTCHRMRYESILTDPDYLAALDNGDTSQQSVYASEALTISRLQKDILKIVKQEKPFDVFISYKETDEYGKRTQDSVIANDIYHELTQDGYKVFYSAITLEDKLGQAYEPYIFAALNSAKVMLVVGTKPAYYNAVWVKNEWSRYLSLMKEDKNRTLIPCYRDMDAYSLPAEFSHLQAQDMSKIGFINDIVRGMKKLLSKKESQPSEPVVINGGASAVSMLERAFLSLEDGEWGKADGLLEQVLNMEPKNAEAYVGKLMAELHAKDRSSLAGSAEPLEKYNNYQKAVRFGNGQLKSELEDYNKRIVDRNENARLEGIYNRAKSAMHTASKESDFIAASEIFKTIPNYKDADTKVAECLEKAEIAPKEAIYISAISCSCGGPSRILSAISLFDSVSGYKDSGERADACRRRLDEFKVKAEQERLENKRRAEAERIATENRAEAERIAAEKQRNHINRIAAIVMTVACACIAFAIILNVVILPPIRYNHAMECITNGQYDEGYSLLRGIAGYKDARTILTDACIERYSPLISAGRWHTVGLKSDGTVVATGSNESGKCNVSDWMDIVAVSAGISYTVGLQSDGTVVATGNNWCGETNVFGWAGIIAISAGLYHTVGLKSDGTVVATGSNDDGQCNVSDWTDIVAVSVGYSNTRNLPESDGYTVGLKSDGTVVATGKNDDGRCYVSGWTDIIAVSAGSTHTDGLKSDGTVVTVDSTGNSYVNNWTDIVAVSAGDGYTIGLKSDGTVVASGRNDEGQCDVSDWSDIVAVSAGDEHTIGLKSDGTVVETGINDYERCNVSGWDLF